MNLASEWRQGLSLVLSQDCTAALSRPSTTPMTNPVARSVNVVIHGSIRRHLWSSSWYQRTVRNRCSSVSRFVTSAGRAAARTTCPTRVSVSCRIAVGQETPTSTATRLTARTSPDKALTIRPCNRAVRRARGGICSVLGERDCPAQWFGAPPPLLDPPHTDRAVE